MLDFWERWRSVPSRRWRWSDLLWEGGGGCSDVILIVVVNDDD